MFHDVLHKTNSSPTSLGIWYLNNSDLKNIQRTELAHEGG